MQFLRILLRQIAFSISLEKRKETTRDEALTHFMTSVSLYAPLNHQKTNAFNGVFKEIKGT